ncbi:kinesin-like protein KIN-14C isoform X2 [Ananas comosus]|uniref:Kinesin-like protein KIN-14C isoform X2 n=1 Tax=Ananas comosus TaxID=4615 RepID=A0A6P5GAL8_ANACO|nr:kinesin-like protein KIN-14C isoform X2 [Ananas comosus]
MSLQASSWRRDSMGSVDSEVEAASRRADLLEWLNSLFPDFDVPVDASEEELREQLYDGTVLCCVLNRLIPGVVESELLLQSSRGAFFSSDQQLNNVKRFLSIIAEMGLPGFSIMDLEQGSMSAVVECLLNLRDHLHSELGEDGFLDAGNIGGQFRKRWRLPEIDRSTALGVDQGDSTQDQQISNMFAEGRRKGQTESKLKSTSRSPAASGSKFREVFQIKRGSYSDLPAAKISEMMHSNSLDNAPTRSLLSVVNGILDESVERKKGEIPHRVVYLLRKVVQEIERRISTQAEHIRNQNNLIKTREEKYRSRINALETLVDGTNEENQIVMNRLLLIKAEKSKTEEKSQLGEQEIARLLKDKEDADIMISKLKEEMEMKNKMYEHRCVQLETKAKESEAQLTQQVKEVESLLSESMKKIEELEVFSEVKVQSWKKKEQTFQHFINNQQYSVKDLKMSSESIKQEVINCQKRWTDEISNFGVRLKGLIDAAENYHTILAQNQKLFNEVQELKGNIRVYCRIRPFLPGQNEKSTTIDYIGENGELLISNPYKQGKDGHRMFKFNKVFCPAASQVEVFSDIQPLIRSVLDGYNVCIFAYGQTGSGKTYTMSGPGTSKEDWGVNYRALNDLFDISGSRRNTFLYEVGVQMVEIYNEQVRDLLSNDVSQKRLGIWSTSQPNGLVVPDASLHLVQSTSDVLDLMEIGQANRAVGSTALNERSSRSHSILTVHVRGMDLKNGSTSRGCLHLIDLAGSERVERSEATGDRLKEAQHINKSLSALGDVIFALAQKSTHVPYRNSKLTQVLQSSLGGQAKTLMFVQINPDVESYSETISTLKFAERVSGVELGAAKSNKEGKDIKELLEQVASLKDTIAKKDEEIEQLHLLKDFKSRTSIGNIERAGGNSLRHSSSSPGIPSLGLISQQGQLFAGGTLVKSTGRVSLDPEGYSEFNNHKQAELNGGENGRGVPADAELVGLDEADYEDRLSDVSDGGFSVGETDGSLGSALEFVSYLHSGKPAEVSTEKACKALPKITRSLPTKSVQPTSSRPKLKDPLKSSSHAKSLSGQITASAAKPPRRWQ